MKKIFLTMVAAAALGFPSLAVADEGTTSVPVKMTYVNMDDPDKAYGEIPEGETAEAGFNKINGDAVGFGNTGWGVNFITYLQVNVSEIEGNITQATLSFEASGSTDSKRTTGWGAGYNSSAWSSDMTYNTADKSITTVGEQVWTSTKSAGTFENLSIDITAAVKNADENGLVTILVYETAAAGGYIKNPVVEVNWTTAVTYEVSFKESNGIEATVTVNNLDVTKGTTLPDGTYTFTATAPGYKDFTGEFTVAGEALEVEFSMTPKEIWNYTVNAYDAEENLLGILSSGSGFENEGATYYYPEFYLSGTTLLSKARNGSNPYWGTTANIDKNDAEFRVIYDGEPISNVVFYKEAEEMEGFTSRDSNNAPIRCSNGLGGTTEEDVLLTTLPAGKYVIFGQVWGTNGLTAGVKIKAASEDGEDTNLWVLESTGSLTSSTSEEFTLSADTQLYVYTTDGNHNRMLDLIYIQKTGDAGDDNPETPEITVALDKASVETEVGETVQLTASYLPEDAEDVVLAWSSSDEAIATVDENGLVTAIAAGECVITVALASDETVKAECTVTVKAKEENPENPEVKTLYSRTEETWTEADLEEWVNDNAQYVSQTIDGGLKMAGTNSGWNSTKEITYAENSIVTLTATLHGGAAPGRSGSYDFLKLGGAEVRMNGQDKKASVVIGETETALTGYTRDADYIITMTINQASKDVTVSVEGGAEGEATGKLAEALPNNVVVGHYKAGRENYEVVEILKAISISEELQTVTMIDYTVNYTCDGEIIKTEEGSTTAGNEVTAATTLTVDDQKYYLAEGAETVLIVTEEGENVLNVEMRKAYVFNYIVKNNVNEETMTGECVEGESATVPFSKYILAADGTVWTKGANSSNPWYGETITPDADNYEVTLEYAVATETIKAENEGEEDIVNDITNGIFFSEAENIEGMTEATGSNANIRCSNQAGGYAEEAVALYTLKPGTYKVRIGVWGNAGAEFVVKAGEETIMTAETQGYWFEAASEEFTLAEETALTFEGANASHPLDYILITGKEKSDVPTGVAALGFDSNSPVKVYDLNGRYMSDKVEGLQGGIYVIRQGNNAKKVIIK